MSKTKEKKDPPLASEQHAAEREEHYQERRDAGLPAFEAQEFGVEVEGVSLRTVGGVGYLRAGGGEELVLDQTGVFSVMTALQKMFQAVS